MTHWIDAANVRPVVSHRSSRLEQTEFEARLEIIRQTLPTLGVDNVEVSRQTNKGREEVYALLYAEEEKE